jgi:hypothetical protein
MQPRTEYSDRTNLQSVIGLHLVQIQTFVRFLFCECPHIRELVACPRVKSLDSGTVNNFLLQQGAEPVVVAGELGFHDQSHLSKQFKRYVGLNPSEYRAGMLSAN